ncbi:uncharacterized protein AMSG_09739 [Thecamonas trahens ATCC 50062]|uniref:Tyrosine specific protein phosphatases domain-containing protein n=1 Tax=Thecamonas trahens ATCC 50062 TaxID=461836 RepID=A0A0L0DP57_THETB|nr:hypothetical protein AMSG_09739 [Thecamonas trahens ATCC 50062]KNC54074.1 hypothetical protein AMSG_09739 [Thecamonas trahens ATCC 50062]|eukprot:XP_013754083.1 hypothetical protein AMSG_09739 [Thecamonas trahens ATCC 50062]
MVTVTTGILLLTLVLGVVLTEYTTTGLTFEKVRLVSSWSAGKGSRSAEKGSWSAGKGMEESEVVGREEGKRLSNSSTTVVNYLFRSDLPEIGSAGNRSFAWNELMSYMAERADAAGLPWPTHRQPYVVDLSLLDAVKDASKYDVEKKFFAAHPELGEFHLWSIWGIDVNPNSLGKHERNAMLDVFHLWDVDQLSSRLPDLHKMMTTDYGAPRVFLFHCYSGVDRTGDMAAGT